MIALGVVLACAAVLAHASGALIKQPLSYAIFSAAQLGLPVAAATVGGQLGVLRPGEDAALLLGALLTIVAATVSGRRAARQTPTGSGVTPGT
jgi:hypothetical protein